MSYQHVIKTRYSETAQDGIIHHSSFIVYLEIARIEYFKTIGCDINEIEKEGNISPVVDLSIRYLKPLKSLEEIAVKVVSKNVSRVRFQLEYEISRGSDIVATAISTHCFLNSNFQPIAIPEKFKLK